MKAVVESTKKRIKRIDMQANIELLTKVRNHIAKFPQAVNMDYFKIMDADAKKAQRTPDQWNGFAGCVGGLSIVLSGGRIAQGDSGRNFELSRARLGLSAEETRGLLYFDHANVSGPYEDLRDDLLRANIGTTEYAAVVIKAIDRCIALHSPKPDAIDLEANAVCVGVEAKIKHKSLVTRELTRKEVYTSLVGMMVLVLAFVRFAI